MKKEIRLERIYNKIEKLLDEATTLRVELAEGMIKEDVNRGAMLND